MAVGLLASASRGHAQVSLSWTNGSGNWNSTTAWQTNFFTAYTNDFTGGGTNSVTNTFCQAILPANSIVVSNCVPGGTGAFPSIGDEAQFTNSANPNITVTGSTSVRSLVFITNAVVTIGGNASATTLTVTDAFRIAQSANNTATVYWAGGTLAVTNNTPGQGGQALLQIGSGSNSVGALVVTNGTVLFDPNTGGSSVGRGFRIGGNASHGTLVISGTGSIVTNRISGAATLSMEGGATTGNSQLIITNGGKLFMSGTTLVLSNGLVRVSDPGSVMSNADAGVGSGGTTIGSSSATAPGTGHSMLIVSNGATVWNQGTIAIGRAGSAFNTGIVVGAGSKLIAAPGNFQVGGTAGSSNNDLVVYDGGFMSCGGTMNVPDSAPNPNNSFHMGGIGAMSTGIVVGVLKNNSGAQNSTIVVSNAVLTCGQMLIQGIGGNTLSVLSNATLIFSNQYAVSATLTNVLNINAPAGALTINAGTVRAVSGSNAISFTIGNTAAGSVGNVMTISNGGKLLSEFGTIGPSSSFNTGVVTGVGSVWSNFTAGVSYNNSNSIAVGGGTSFSGNNNYLAVLNGATLVNNGSLNIGNTGSSTLNAVVFGGPGLSATITNSGEVNIGNGLGTSGNSLTISNATLFCDSLNVAAGTNRINNSLVFNGGTIFANFVKVRQSNTFVFTAGTLSAGGMDTDSGANNSNEFVVGDGTSAAYYDMAAGGTGYHSFGSPGLVVTNGASLRGSGTLTGTLTVLGTFVPGFSVGSIFTSNSLTFGSSAVLNYDLGTVSDTATINGNLALGSSTLNVTDSGGFAAGTYVLFTHTNTVSAPPGTLTVGTLPAGFAAMVSNDVPTARVLLVVTSSDPYSAWASHYFPSGGPISLGNADPDFDGVNNTNEFLSGFNPTNAGAYAHVISIAKQSGNMNVTYLGANGDDTWSPGIGSRTNILEFTTGTANGSYSNNFASTGVTNVLSGGHGLGTNVTATDTGGATGTTRYYRIRVLAP